MSWKDRFKNARTKFRIEEVTNEAVLAALDVPEGERLFLREMSSKDKKNYELSRIKTESFVAGKGAPKSELNLNNTPARLLVKTLCDEHGVKHFADDDATWLGELPDSVIDPLYEQARRVAGVDKEADEELEKNLNGPNVLANGLLPCSSGGTT